MGILNEHSQRMRSWNRFIESIARRPYLFAGMTFYWIWINMGYQTPIVFGPVAFDPNFSLPAQIGPFFVSFLSYLIISIWFKRKRIVFQKNGFLWFIGILMSFSSAVLVIWLDCTMVALPGTNAVALISESMRLLSPLLYAVGSVLCGASAAFMCIEMQRIYGSLGSEHVLFHGSMAMLASIVVIYPLTYAPGVVRQIVFIAAPLPLAFFLLRGRAGLTKQELFKRGLQSELNIPYKLLVTAMLHGLSFGVLLGSFTMRQGGAELLACGVFSYAAAAVLMLFTAITFKLNFNSLIYQIGFPLIAVGMYASIIMGSGSLFAVSVQMAGFCYLHLIMWGACAFLIKNFDLPATWVIGTSTCLFMAGQLCGTVASGFASQLPGAAGRVDFITLTALVVVLGASLFTMSSKNLRTGWGLAKPDTYRAHSEEQMGFVIRTIVSENELTKREAGILESLIRGKNRRTISEEGCISVETAKSHIQNIYKKVGVHSQQELIRFVEDRMAQYDE